MKTIILLTTIWVGMFLLFSCAANRFSHVIRVDPVEVKKLDFDQVKERVNNRKYGLMVYVNGLGVINVRSTWDSFGYSFQVNGDTLFNSNAYYKIRSRHEISDMPYYGKIVDYRQRTLPDGKVEVTFSIEVISYMIDSQNYMQDEYPYQENKEVTKWKLVIPTSYRIVFGPKNKARVWMDDRSYEAEVKDFEKDPLQIEHVPYPYSPYLNRDTTREGN